MSKLNPLPISFKTPMCVTISPVFSLYLIINYRYRKYAHCFTKITISWKC